LFLEFIKNNPLSLFSILVIIAFIVISILLIIEMRKLKKQLNDNGVQKNNVSEILNVQRMILNKLNSNENGEREITEENLNKNNDYLNIKKGKYTENEIGDMIIDIVMELKKTSKRLNNWKSFGLLIITVLIVLIITSIYNA
jgi:hypothetical protein